MDLVSARSDVLSEVRSLIDSGRGTGLVSVTVPIDGADPSALVLGSRRATDRWSVWEQPDRSGFALATLGQVREITSRGERRFEHLEEDSIRLVSQIDRRGPESLPQGAGPVFAGGFAFDPEGCASREWSSLPPALLVLPEISLCRSDGEVWLTATADLGSSDSSDLRGERALERLESRLASLEEAAMPSGLGGVADSADVEVFQGSEAWGPAAYEEAVSQATARIRRGEIDKVVLARSLRLERDGAWEAPLVVGALREAFSSCFCFAIGTPELTFCGASPELLIRRSGPLAATVALAGSARRSADPAVDAHLGEALLQSSKDRSEHGIVVERIVRSLRRLSLWVEADPEPSLARISNIQHLATPIRAQLSNAVSAIELAGRLHPTPAVGGEPAAEALEVIREIERIDRGWYAGPVGWVDCTGDGEFCVALRSALIRDTSATLYAGAGIVADSDPSTELAETELKLGAMLPLLS